MSDARVARVDAVLASRGFVRVDGPPGFPAQQRQGSDHPNLWYHGRLAAKRGATDVYLHIADLNLVSAPSIWLLERPTWLQGWRPHLLGVDSLPMENLCYNDFEQYQLLSHDLGAAILRVLVDATDTLDRIANPESVIQDSRKDFPRLWTSNFQDVYIDCIPSTTVAQCETATFEDEAGKLTVLVSQDPAALATRLGGATVLKRSSRHALVFPDDGSGLYLNSLGPPSDLRQVLAWLQDTAPQTGKRWHQRVQERNYYRSNTPYHFFVSRGQVVGFFIDYPSEFRRVNNAKDTREAFAKSVYHKPLPVFRLHAQRLDDEYLVRRNLAPEQMDLRGKRVLLIGAGAIGGFLALNLLQLGAGLRASDGAAGALTICDQQTLSPANIGRHLLGLKYLGQAKAAALCDYLRESHPGCQVQPVVGDFRPDAAMLADFDIVIEATGYETYSRFLSRLCRSSGWLGQVGHTLLQVWIEGRGAVVRGLLQDALRDACYDCLWNYAATTEPAARYAAYSEASWNIHGDDGYATMTPFAVSAPLAAAALSVDLLATRGREPAAPKFVSRTVEAPGVNRPVSKTLSRATKCPGCGEG
jgi:molybdopterin/thiamine biosynthesis adenylyltransferase